MRWILVMVAALFAVCVGCADNEVGTIQTPPEIVILSPDDDETIPEYAIDELIEVVASVDDSFDAPQAVQVNWSTSYLDDDGVQQELDLGPTGVGEDGRTTLVTSNLAIAVHTIRATATDTDGLQASDYVNVSVIEMDEIPDVEIGSPEDGDIFQEGDDVNFLAVASDDHGPSTLTVAWHSNLDGFLGGDPAAPNGMITLVVDDLSPGDQEVTVWVTDEAGNSGSDMVAFVVEATNQPPTDPVVYIIPAGPLTDDDLTCVADGSADPEGGVVTFEFAWDQNGSPTGWSSDVVPASQTTRHDEWICRVTAYDDELVAGNEVSATVIIDNSLPSYSSVSLAPNPAYEDDELECTPYGWADPDGDAEGAQFEWFVNATLVAGATSDTLFGADFDHFDTVECSVYPDDGVDLGQVRDSNPVEILNTTPEAPDLEFLPSPPRVDQDLLCNIAAAVVDPDPDTHTFEYEWFRDGVFDASLTNDTVPYSEITMGDEWTCRARAWDGYEFGPWAEITETVLPYAGDLVITEIMVDPDAVGDTLGEYFEVYNTSNNLIPLDGWIIEDGVNELHQVTSGGTANIYPGDYFVFGVNGNAGTNGGVTVDYQYADISLSQGYDGIVLSLGGVVVDEVQYDWGITFPLATGTSMILDPTLISDLANDQGANWCGSTTLIDATGDFGTPGDHNDACECWDSDDDLDGYGDDPACDPSMLDCDDADASIHPGAEDICDDGIDQDCDGIDRECTCAETDLDGDGYGTAVVCADIDCDDTNPAVHPGAVEICNGIDDDCDIDVDEGYDNDGDGVATCMGDCDDNNDAVFPGNPETCDAYDNDCNGLVDEGYNVPGCTVFYLDQDGDMYGQTNAYVCSCAPDGNYTAQDYGDCDDGDPAVNPGATEVCDDVDNDCDGNVDEAWGDCTVANGVAGCVAGDCVIDSCDPDWFDMDSDYFTGCEVEQDEWEAHGGDSCANAVNQWAPFTDYPGISETITGNIAYDHFFPTVDEDWYYITATDVPDVDGSCDTFDVEVFFSGNPNSDFKFEIYDTGCNLWATPGNACGNDLTEFNWDASGECPCTNAVTEGYELCTDNSITFIVRVYRVQGGPDGNAYMLTVSNG